LQQASSCRRGLQRSDARILTCDSLAESEVRPTRPVPKHCSRTVLRCSSGRSAKLSLCTCSYDRPAYRCRCV
jgi:hypothetical protein